MIAAAATLPPVHIAASPGVWTYHQRRHLPGNFAQDGAQRVFLVEVLLDKKGKIGGVCVSDSFPLWKTFPQARSAKKNGTKCLRKCAKWDTSRPKGHTGKAPNVLL